MLKKKIESLLFVSDRPLAIKELAKILQVKNSEVDAAIKELVDEYNLKNGGIMILYNDQKAQMATASDSREVIEGFLKEELHGDLSPASLETLSIVAYRSPIAREEIEQIRGVNCAIILRNLSVKGLVETENISNKIYYRLTVEMMKYLGFTKLNELPNYEELHRLEIPISLLSVSAPVENAPSQENSIRQLADEDLEKLPARRSLGEGGEIKI
ncbi:MAG: SMC-Scp complex subunit ScpB [Patescibacteria group bacterium]|mgnify:FL=1